MITVDYRRPGASDAIRVSVHEAEGFAVLFNVARNCATRAVNGFAYIHGENGRCIAVVHRHPEGGGTVY